jgi:hypothetical protein
VFVWTVWAALLIGQAVVVALYGSDVPLWDDWTMASPLSGHVGTLSWLWAFHNEHWIPLPKAIILELMHLTGGDVRAGMAVNVLLMGVFGASMIVAASGLRGYTAYTDVFFPLVILHGGHAADFFWCWQLGFVLPAMLSGIVLATIVQKSAFLTLRRVTLAAVCLALLPLCGGNGLAMVPALGAWFFLYVGHNWNRSGKRAKRQRLAVLALTFLALGLAAVNGISLARLPYLHPSPTMARTVVTAFQFCSTSLGLWPWPFWCLVACVAIGLALVLATFSIKQAVVRANERLQIAGILCFLSAMGCLTTAVGWGRGSMGWEAGLSDRYSVLAVSWLCCIYLGWLVVGGALAKPLMGSLAIIAALAAVPNTQAGFGMIRERYYNMWYARHDLNSGVSAQLFALKYSRGPLMLYPNERELASYLTMLRRANVPRFRQLPTGRRPTEGSKN